MLTLKLVLSSGQIENSKQQKFQVICVTRYFVFTLAVVSPKGIESQRNNASQVVSDHVHVLLPWTSVDGQPRLDGRTKRGDFGELPKNEPRLTCLKVRAENTFLLALDGDVDFQPEAIIKVTRS